MRRALVVAPLALLVAGCITTTTVPSPVSSIVVPSPSSAPGPTSTPGATGAPPTPGPSTSAAPELHADPELEAIFPADIDGDPVEVQTIRAVDYALALPEESTAADQFDRFLSETGVEPATVTMAFATWRRAASPLGFQAIRGPAGRPDRLVAAAVYLARVSQADPARLTVETRRAGGKGVTVVLPGGAEGVPTWVYPRGEVVFLISGDEATVAPILEALPF